MGREDLQIRDIRVLHLLASSRGMLTTKAIADHMQLPIRTVQRIISAIEGAGFPMKRDSAAMGGGIKLLTDLALKITLPGNLVEAAALMIARERMRETTGGTLLGEAMETLTERVFVQMTPAQRALTERFARFYSTKSTAPAAATPIATLVHKALDAGQVLVIEYVSKNEHRPSRREIEPAGIWVTDAGSYLFGRDRAKDALRTFAIDRIRGATLSEEHFAPGAIDAAAYFKHALGAFAGGDVLQVEVELDAEAARRLGARRPNDSVSVTKRPDGGAVVHLDAPLSDELLAWMVELGPGVSVTAPAAASQFVRDGFKQRADAQPKPRAQPTSRAPRKKPLAMPGPLLRKMKGR